MASTRHVILMHPPPEAHSAPEASTTDSPTAAPCLQTKALGTQQEVRALLATYNTARDGSDGSIGIDRLYGPGFIVEIPTSLDELAQLMVHIDDDETAWPVMQRLCKETGWAMCDMETGRRFI